MTRLAGRAVVVTGGNSGLGLGMAEGLGRAGAQVAIWARNQERNVRALAQLADAGIETLAVQCDTSSETDVEAAMAATLHRFGRVDAMFANAGIASAEPLVETSLESWQKIMRVNVDGTFLCTRAAAGHMIERGGGGALIVVSSIIARYGAIGQAAYATSKTALLGLSRTLAAELARHDIRCNALIPGWTATAMNEHLRQDDRFVAATTRRTPARRWATPAEFHEVAVFLADPSLTFHTGDEVVVDGGYTIY